MATLEQLEGRYIRLGAAKREVVKPGQPRLTRSDLAYIEQARARTSNSISYQASQFLRERNFTSAGEFRKVWKVIGQQVEVKRIK